MPFGIRVNITPKELRSLGRWALKGKWTTAIMASVLSLFIVNIPPIVLNMVMGPEKWANVVDAYTMLINAPMMLGLTSVFLRLFRKQNTSPVEIFHGFEYIMKAVVLQIFMALLITLQTMCFVIPGIIAIYRYSLAFFVMADDPRKRPMQCITESKYLMYGNKMQMFKLTISFIGWFFLTGFPMGMAMVFFPTDNWLLYELVILATGLLPCIVEPYFQVTVAAFYEIAKGDLRIKRTTPEYQAYDTTQNMNFTETAAPAEESSDEQ